MGFCVFSLPRWSCDAGHMSTVIILVIVVGIKKVSAKSLEKIWYNTVDPVLRCMAHLYLFAFEQL